MGLFAILAEVDGPSFTLDSANVDSHFYESKRSFSETRYHGCEIRLLGGYIQNLNRQREIRAEVECRSIFFPSRTWRHSLPESFRDSLLVANVDQMTDIVSNRAVLTIYIRIRSTGSMMTSFKIQGSIMVALYFLCRPIVLMPTTLKGWYLCNTVQKDDQRTYSGLSL